MAYRIIDYYQNSFTDRDTVKKLKDALNYVRTNPNNADDIEIDYYKVSEKNEQTDANNYNYSSTYKPQGSITLKLSDAIPARRLDLEGFSKVNLSGIELNYADAAKWVSLQSQSTKSNQTKSHGVLLYTTDTVTKKDGTTNSAAGTLTLGVGGKVWLGADGFKKLTVSGGEMEDDAYGESYVFSSKTTESNMTFAGTSIVKPVSVTIDRSLDYAAVGTIKMTSGKLDNYIIGYSSVSLSGGNALDASFLSGALSASIKSAKATLSVNKTTQLVESISGSYGASLTHKCTGTLTTSVSFSEAGGYQSVTLGGGVSAGDVDAENTGAYISDEFKFAGSATRVNQFGGKIQTALGLGLYSLATRTVKGKISTAKNGHVSETVSMTNKNTQGKAFKAEKGGNTIASISNYKTVTLKSATVTSNIYNDALENSSRNFLVDYVYDEGASTAIDRDVNARSALSYDGLNGDAKADLILTKASGTSATSGTLKLTDTAVWGDAWGFTTATLDGSSVMGDLAAYSASLKYTTKRYTSTPLPSGYLSTFKADLHGAVLAGKNFIQLSTITVSGSAKASGTLTAKKGSSVGRAYGYNTVTLDSSSASVLGRATADELDSYLTALPTTDVTPSLAFGNGSLSWSFNVTPIMTTSTVGARLMETWTQKADLGGKVTVKAGSSAGDIIGYKSVTLARGSRQEGSILNDVFVSGTRSLQKDYTVAMSALWADPALSQTRTVKMEFDSKGTLTGDNVNTNNVAFSHHNNTALTGANSYFSGESNYYVIGGYGTVKLSNSRFDTVDIFGGSATQIEEEHPGAAPSNELKMTASGSLTLTNCTGIRKIAGYKTVTISASTITGSVSCNPNSRLFDPAGSSTPYSNVVKSSIKLTDVNINGALSGYRSVSVNGTTNVSYGAVTGTVADDSLSVAKSLIATFASMDFGLGDDTLSIGANGNATITGLLNFGAGADTLNVNEGARLSVGSINFGAGKDSVTVSKGATLIISSAFDVATLEKLSVAKGAALRVADESTRYQLETKFGKSIKGTLAVI